VAPELAYVTARYAALAPFGKVADLLSELLPISGAPNVDGCLNPPEFGDMGSAAVAGSD
jgi:hypothetical protein